MPSSFWMNGAYSINDGWFEVQTGYDGGSANPVGWNAANANFDDLAGDSP